MAKPNVAILQGTLDVMILKALSWQPLHGYGIIRLLRTLSNEALQIEEGTLYPALHRMEHRGLVKSDWGASENNRRAKYYTITALGRRTLRDDIASWSALSGAVGKVLFATEAPI